MILLRSLLTTLVVTTLSLAWSAVGSPAQAGDATEISTVTYRVSLPKDALDGRTLTLDGALAVRASVNGRPIGELPLRELARTWRAVVADAQSLSSNVQVGARDFTIAGTPSVSRDGDVRITLAPRNTSSRLRAGSSTMTVTTSGTTTAAVCPTLGSHNYTGVCVATLPLQQTWAAAGYFIEIDVCSTTSWTATSVYAGAPTYSPQIRASISASSACTATTGTYRYLGATIFMNPATSQDCLMQSSSGVTITDANNSATARTAYLRVHPTSGVTTC